MSNKNFYFIESKEAPSYTDRVYPQAITVDNILYLSGQVGEHPKTGKVSSDFTQEVKQTFDNIKAVLAAANLTLDDILTVTIYFTNIKKDYEVFNKIYTEYFGAHKPVRISMEISALSLEDTTVEVQATAYLKK